LQEELVAEINEVLRRHPEPAFSGSFDAALAAIHRLGNRSASAAAAQASHDG
jgi:hypothetical protein